MQNIKLGKSDLEVSNISLGCMRMGDLSKQDAANVIHNAMELGVNFFDHADIYASGETEETFADAIDMNPTIREKIYIQTKAGIRDVKIQEYVKEWFDKNDVDVLHQSVQMP